MGTKSKQAEGRLINSLSQLHHFVSEAQAEATNEILGRGLTYEHALEVSDNAHSFADAMCQDAIKKTRMSEPLACLEGCSWCCYQLVVVAVPDVLRIVAYLKENLTAEKVEAITTRVSEADKATRNKTTQERYELRIACPLLENDRCVAYPVRPLMCRGYYSTDAHKCKTNWLQAKTEAEPLEIEMPLASIEICEAATNGVQAGLAKHPVASDLVELIAALKIALTRNQAAERWLSGNPVFSQAKTNRTPSR